MDSSPLIDLEQLASRTRRDTSVDGPVLLTAGALATCTVTVNLMTGHPEFRDALHGQGSWLLVLLLPLALAGLWLHLRRRESRRGAGRQSRAVGWAAIVVAFAGIGLGLTVFLGPYPLVMGLVVLAGMRFRSTLVLAWGLACGGLGLWAGMFQFNNRFGLSGCDDGLGVAIAVATVLLGTALTLRDRRR